MTASKPLPLLTEKDRVRFLAKVALPDDRGCCLWTSTAVKGYGTFGMGRRDVKAHRVSYTLFVGPVPDALDIDHRCHVTLCVTPDHLRPATRKQNEENRAAANNGSSTGVRGVFRWTKNGRTRWQVKITHHGRQHWVGIFDTVEEAETAAIAARLRLFTHNDRDRQEVG